MKPESAEKSAIIATIRLAGDGAGRATMAARIATEIAR